MFGFLKDKLKGALGKLTKEVEKDSVVEKKEVLVEKKPEKKEEAKTRPTTDKTPQTEQIKVQKIEEPKKRGFFQKIFGKKEEEEIIEEKEELLARAEKTIIEPIQKPEHKLEHKPAPAEPKIEKQKDTKNIETEVQEFHKEKITIPEKKLEIQKEETKIPDKEILILKNKSETIKTENIEQEKSNKIEPNIEPIIEKIEPIKIHKQEPITPKPQPHYQVIEEERTHKVAPQKEEEHKGFFTKITETFTKIQISEEKFEELFWELEVVLLENNVAVEVIDKIKRDLKKELMTGKVSRKGVEELILSTLKQSITELFDVEKIDLIKKIKEKRQTKQPYVIAIIGVNGSGKTTSIAKLAHKFQKEGLSVVLAASDTFRAAAIQQLEEHANRLNVKMVKHDYNSDPAAVAFDAIKYAEAKNVDVVIIDTAGRLHSNTNLMRELEKVIRVCKPDIKIFVGESITGNDCVEQAKEFDKAVGIDAIILAKADVDDKGGAAISVSYILQRPILYLGTGQTYDDLKEFDSKLILESLEL
jgi:fused signal recognition particle receptor